MDLEPCFNVHNLALIQLKSTKLSKLGQMINLKVVFHMVMSIYKLDTICNSTQSLAQPQSGQKTHMCRQWILIGKSFHSL